MNDERRRLDLSFGEFATALLAAILLGAFLGQIIGWALS